MIIGMICSTCPVTPVGLRLVSSARAMVELSDEQGRVTQTHRLTPRQRNGTAPCAAGELA